MGTFCCKVAKITDQSDKRKSQSSLCSRRLFGYHVAFAYKRPPNSLIATEIAEKSLSPQICGVKNFDLEIGGTDLEIAHSPWRGGTGTWNGVSWSGSPLAQTQGAEVGTQVTWLPSTGVSLVHVHIHRPLLKNRRERLFRTEKLRPHNEMLSEARKIIIVISRMNCLMIGQMTKRTKLIIEILSQFEFLSEILRHICFQI